MRKPPYSLYCLEEAIHKNFLFRTIGNRYLLVYRSMFMAQRRTYRAKVALVRTPATL